MKIVLNKILQVFVVFLLSYSISFSQSQIARDNFEGNSTISSWIGDDCNIDANFINPFTGAANSSARVLRYADFGGQYANINFDAGFQFNLATSSQFSFKIYVPSSGITGNQTNQVSLKLQNGFLAVPWETQCEIIKPILLNQWQTVSFDFATDPYINLNPNSANPINRWDFSRVLIQVNGENNNAQVLAYIDDFLYTGAISTFNNLVWNDEFDGSGVVNNTKWFHQTQLPNGSSWYNGELQHYTNRSSNSYLSNGILNIMAKKEAFSSQGHTKQYTSARLNSKFAFKYGRVEVRAKLPTGAGTWPAIWMLGKNINEPGGFWKPTHGTTNWPACGEIDIMEHWGTNQNVISSAVHFPVNGNLSVGQYVTNAQTKTTVSSQFHVYAVDWNAQRITFSVDGVNHFSYSPPVKNQFTWPFDAEQYLLLNVAIEPSVLNTFVQSAMEIDYVRVYQESSQLPLNFTHFSVASNNNKTVENKWTTTNEINVAYFSLTRSTNGKDFSTIAKIASKNQALNSYSFIDELPIANNQSKIYYQIQSIDKDGTKNYSEIRQLTLENTNKQVRIYPNPAKSLVTINGLLVGDSYSISDVKGTIMQQAKVTQSNFTVDVSHFVSGVYFLKASNGVVQKIIKE
jgi:beta-glucanase (GH16 family)